MVESEVRKVPSENRVMCFAPKFLHCEILDGRGCVSVCGKSWKECSVGPEVQVAIMLGYS